MIPFLSVEGALPPPDTPPPIASGAADQTELPSFASLMQGAPQRAVALPVGLMVQGDAAAFAADGAETSASAIELVIPPMVGERPVTDSRSNADPAQAASARQGQAVAPSPPFPAASAGQAPSSTATAALPGPQSGSAPMQGLAGPDLTAAVANPTARPNAAPADHADVTTAAETPIPKAGQTAPPQQLRPGQDHSALMSQRHASDTGHSAAGAGPASGGPDHPPLVGDRADPRPTDRMERQTPATPAAPATAPTPRLAGGHLADPARITADADVALRLSDAALPLSGHGTERSVIATTSQPTAQGQPQTADMARHAAAQLAMSVAQTAQKTTEIALNPEELGRVRLTLSAGEGSLALSILAERPDTADLLRRHIDVLAQEFRALGYVDISFSFHQDGSADHGATASAPPQQGEGGVPTAAADPAVPATPASRQEAGLDLRL